MAKYKIYVDAAANVQSNVSGVAFCVLKESKCIYSFKKRLDVGIITVAETYAICYALDYVQKKLAPEDSELSVVLFSDNIYAIERAAIVRNLKRNNIVDIPTSWRTKGELVHLYNLLMNAEYNLNIQKLRAHVKDKTPHAFVDRIAKTVLELGRA